ncbi:hypothetical protein [Terrimonas pollutisoli]|uniref:hypothetical protein n=1 Tax=Terrimonas pollutisoli TaxID=3034147 RepID=UPI0023EA98A9|nr:hypothetical protein [Terrimonas sp. H1YJ31]
MRKIIFSAILFLCCANLFSQQTTPGRLSNDRDYLQKSKNQKKTARILLVSGAGLIISSFVIPRGTLKEDGICVGAFCDKKYKNDGIKTTLLIAGGVVTLASIPLFIASKKNRRKAGAVRFKMENSIQLYNQKLVSACFPALRIKLNL